LLLCQRQKVLHQLWQEDVLVLVTQGVLSAPELEDVLVLVT
jgi:hypothetical protein